MCLPGVWAKAECTLFTFVFLYAHSGRVSGRFVPVPPSAVSRFRICSAGVQVRADVFFFIGLSEALLGTLILGEYAR